MSDKANEKIKKVLTTLLDEHSLDSSESTSFHIPISHIEQDGKVAERELDSIFNNLGEKGIILDWWFPEDNKDNLTDECTIFCPPDFRLRAKEYLVELGVKENNSSTSILYLDKDGNFWHGDKEQFCYPMKATSNRFCILKYLIENEGYQSPRDMLPHVKTKTTQTLRSEIGKIRKNIIKFLSINGDDLIDSKDDSGYRINPKYKILLSKS